MLLEEETSPQTDVSILTEIISIELEESPTQIVNIQQEALQSVIIEEVPIPVIEFSSEGEQGPPGPQGPQGPQGADGVDPDNDILDLTLIFNNGVI
jgi:hypothetical protein